MSINFTEPTEFMSALANNLRHLRKLSGLTQQQLAEGVGVSYPRISEIENGRGNPTVETLQRIADVLKVDVADLLKIPKKKK
jgi:transcriptional regulator with XRE-family HTH domain